MSVNTPFLFKTSPIDKVSLFHLQVPMRINEEKNPSKQPIGKQFEDDVLAALATESRYELIAHGLQIHDQGITKGEFDLLLRDIENQRILHVEIVRKFYVYHEALLADDQLPWIGPAFKDRLSYKLEHLSSRQFPLLHSALARPALEQVNIAPDAVDQGLCFAAELFAHRSSHVKWPEHMDRNALVGEHIYYDELHLLRPEHSYAVLEKSKWLFTPTAFLKRHDWLDLNQVKGLCERFDKPCIVLEKTPEALLRHMLTYRS